MVTTPNKIAPKLAIFIGLLCLLNVLSVRAEFELNFKQPSGGGLLPGSCNTGTGATGLCPIAGNAQEIDPDTTPFSQNVVYIEGVGNTWHQIIGDPAEGFAMELYITYGTDVFLSEGSGGRPSQFPHLLHRTDLDVQSGNGWDPLGLNSAIDHKTTGNATGTPTKVVMRQVLGGTWDAASETWSCGGAEFCSDFTKAAFETKPRITQELNDASNDASRKFSAFFDLDMSHIGYSDKETAGTLINRVSLPSTLEPGFGFATVPMTGSNGNAGNAGNGGSFNMDTTADSDDTQKRVVTGGRYTFDDKDTGWTNTGTADGYQSWNFEEGSYDYVSGSFDHLGQNWGTYFDPAQNPFGSGNEDKCDSGLISGTCP